MAKKRRRRKRKSAEKPSDYKPNVRIYCRKSADRQGQTGASVEMQEASVREWCRKRGWKPIAVYVDEDTSGASDIEDRDALPKLLADLKWNEAVVVWRMDRMARSVYVQEAVKRVVHDAGCRLRAVHDVAEGDSPEADLVRGIMAQIAEYERKLIAQRTSAVMKHQQRVQKKRVGSVCPYGWERDPDRSGRMRPEKYEQGVLRQMTEMRDEGKSYREIAAMLEEEGIMSRSGKPFGPSQLRKILVRKIEAEPEELVEAEEGEAVAVSEEGE